MKCLIVDDEPIARLGIQRLVKRHPDMEIVDMVGSADDAMKIIEKSSIDLIFLDIQMPEVTGLELARSIPSGTMVVFTTAYSEYAVDSYELNAVDYLLKPIDPDRFDRAVDKVRNYRQMINSISNSNSISQASVSGDFIIVKADRKYIRIRFTDILYVEGLKDYVMIHLDDRRVITRMTIKAMEELLPKSQFMRVNKSYIANFDKIESFDNNDIFIGTAEIAIGQSYKDTVLQQLLYGDK